MPRLQIENELTEVHEIQLPTLHNGAHLEQVRVCKQWATRGTPKRVLTRSEEKEKLNAVYNKRASVKTLKRSETPSNNES
jgi:hypothetical protein